ncbi:MAG: hypothetical protein LC714_03760, partial [Actinobacteria bacterium]|nr:hypothetical protein [Actinomycetota bacterium]
MFSARKRSPGEKLGPGFWRRAGRHLSPKGGRKPRLGMRVWLTALFVLVTAFAAITAYEIVRPILEGTLRQASEARFKQVGDQFEGLLQQNDGQVSVQQIQSFAATRGLQWGIVRVEGRGAKRLQGDNDLELLPGVVKGAVEDQRSKQDIEQIETGVHAGQLQATYAAPIGGVRDEGGRVVEGTAV